MDLNAYCARSNTAAVITQKLRGKGATVEECMKAAKEFNRLNPKRDGSPRVFGERMGEITGHIAWLRKKQGVPVEQEGDRYRIIENGNDQNDNINGSGINLTANKYLPTKSDFERAILILKKETSKIKFNTEDVLNILEKDLEEAGKVLKEDWRKISKENIKEWFS